MARCAIPQHSTKETTEPNPNHGTRMNANSRILASIRGFSLPDHFARISMDFSATPAVRFVGGMPSPRLAGMNATCILSPLPLVTFAARVFSRTSA